ncbi:transcriptional repressor DicA [Fusobacterium necrophorum subsp. necrophorum]|nr:transcriptional repressor DicA [Fusobacterium necrophorum subsp. necrophorum]
MSKFGNRLKAIRKDLGLTQKELSEKVNKSLSSIQKYEAGEVSIPIEVISLLSEKIECA